MAWTFALGSVLQSSHACVHTKTGLLGLQVAMLGLAAVQAQHATLAALQNGLSQAAQGYWIFAWCAKARKVLYIVPAGCLRG